MATKRISVLFLTLVFAGTAAMLAVARGEQPAPNGLAVARAYIAGMEAGNLDALTELFITDDRSSILENASDEGSWEHYRDHHLKPEMGAAKNFQFEIAQESEKPFGDAILVEQTGAFTVEVKDETLHYRVAVSYLMIVENSQLRIAHLHWSSRPNRQPGKKQNGH